jgi:ribosomal protein S18 acetylase RimI-like enzyme
MARPRQPPAQELQPQPPAALPPGEVADTLGVATGVAAVAAAAAPPAAGAVVGVVAAKAVAEATAKIIAGFTRFFRRRRMDEAIFLRTALRMGYPQRTAREIDDLVAREMQRETEFFQKARERMERDLPKALSIPNREKRSEAVNRLIERERRYVKMREKAMVDRAAFEAERIDVKKASPLGAYWVLDPTLKSHTLDCILMAQRGFWPWEVLDHYHPPLHFQCGCHLLTHREAVERGYIGPDFRPDVKDAIASARSIIERVGRVQESARPEEIEAYLYELLVEAKAGHRVSYEQETEQIKARKDTSEAKARHEFKSAVWTHPNGHPRCRLCGQEERIGGICNGEPTREEAQAWADKQAREGWEGWYVADDGKLKLELKEGVAQEAAWDKRWPKGDPRGGQFRPRRGGIRRSIRRTLRGLVKELPDIARQVEMGKPQGRYVWLRGRHVFVPRNRTFHRRIDDVTFHSPAGSTNIWRDGKLVQIEGQAPPPHHADLDVPAVPDPRLLYDTPVYDPGTKGGDELTQSNLLPGARKEGRRWVPYLLRWGSPPDEPPVWEGEPQTTQRAAANLAANEHAKYPARPTGLKGGGEWPWMENLTPEQAEHALAFMAEGEKERARIDERLRAALDIQAEMSPITVGDSMPAVGDLLEVHGFIPSQSEQAWENGDHVRKWKHMQSGALLSILWNDRTAKVKDVTWTPGRKDWALPEPPINYRPQSWDEFTDEIRGVAYRLAYENNTDPVVGEVRYVEEIGDHFGFHHSRTGLIELGAEVPAVIRLSERRRAGQLATPEERRSAWAGYKVAVHEAIHGAGNVIPPMIYSTPLGKGIEEALTEELSHIETVELLRAHGATEVLEWLRMHPNDYKAVGTYHVYRQAMDEVLNRAKVAPEQREDYLRDLKWNVKPNERVEKIARDLVAVGAEPDFRAASDYLSLRFKGAHRDVEKDLYPTYFAPILRPDLTDYPSSDGVVWNDVRITRGSLVTFKLGGEEHEGVVTEIAQAGSLAKFKLNIRTDDLKLHRHVLDSMLVSAMPSPFRPGEPDEIELNPTVEVLGQHVGVGARIRMKSGPHMKVEGRVAFVDSEARRLRVWIHPTREQDPTYDDYVYEEGTYIEVKADEIGTVLEASQPPTVIKTGNLIHYDGRADGGISEARVTNIVDLGVHRHAAAHVPRYAIEARTTENSLKPGTLVYLTPDRMNGVSVVAEERGLAPVTQLPIPTPTPEPLAVAADEPSLRKVRAEEPSVEEPEPYVDPNTIPIQTGIGPVTFQSVGGDQIGPEYHANYVAVNDQGINVGYVSVAYMGDTAAIKMIEVHPDYRRKGVASALIERVRREKEGVQIETLGDVETEEGRAFIAAGRRSRHVVYDDAVTGDGTDFVRQDAVMRALGALDVNPLERDFPELWEIHPRSGFSVRSDRPRTMLVEGLDAYGKPPRVHDTVPNQYAMNEVEVPGTLRPPRYLFRAISEEDYQASLARGYLLSDQRMNLAEEGTVAAVNDPTFYLPGKLASSEPGEHLGRVVRIEYRDEDGWLLDRDGYVKTPQPIPMERIDAAPQFVTTKEIVSESGAIRLSTRPTGVGMPEDMGRKGDEPGVVRLYRGEEPSGRPGGGAEGTQGRWYTSDFAEASRYAAWHRGQAGLVSYVDIPEAEARAWETGRVIRRGGEIVGREYLVPEEVARTRTELPAYASLIDDRKGGGEPEERHAPSRFLTLPKSGKLREPALEALEAIDGLLRVPTMHGPIPVRATAGKNARGGYLRRAPSDTPRAPTWEGPTVRISGFGRGRGVAPAKRADELVPGDEVLMSGGYRFRVEAVERVTTDPGFGREPVEKVSVTLDRGEDWGDNRLRTSQHKPEEMFAFNWQPPAEAIPPSPEMFPTEIRVSVSDDPEERFSAESTLVHEIGHYIDNQAFFPYHLHRGFASQHASWKTYGQDEREKLLDKAAANDNEAAVTLFQQFESYDAPLHEWFEAVQASPEVEQLSSAAMMEMATHKYLLSPSELWARSFAQWVASRGDSPRMQEWLRSTQNLSPKMTQTVKDWKGEERQIEVDRPKYSLYRQWSEENFEPIGAAMDRMFDRLGWRTDGGDRRDRDADLDAGGGVGAGRDRGDAAEFAVAAELGDAGRSARSRGRTRASEIGSLEALLRDPNLSREDRIRYSIKLRELRGDQEGAQEMRDRFGIKGDPGEPAHWWPHPIPSEVSGEVGVRIEDVMLYEDRPGADQSVRVGDTVMLRTGASGRFVVTGIEGDRVTIGRPVPPKLKLIGPGVYESEDGRITMYRIEGVRPYAWNIEWTIPYENAVIDSGFVDTHTVYANIVDGAASKKDALEIFRAGWPETHAKIVAFESGLRESATESPVVTPPGDKDGVGGSDSHGPVRSLLEALAVPEREREDVIVKLLLLDPEERVGFVDGWLLEAGIEEPLGTLVPDR